MKILIIGGTRFLGRHLIDAALERGHEVTIFHRGKTRSADIENVEEIFGDRNSDLDKLKHRKWEVCIDTCGYLPQTVAASAEFLRNAVAGYVFISSISAYADFSRTDFDETAETAVLTAEQVKEFAEIDPKSEITAKDLGEMYGALKALCEAQALRVFPGKALIIRPGLIVGRFDPTDRFSYWVMRVAKGGEVLAPGDPDRFVQFIDVRDLAEWTIRLIERGEAGIFNGTGRPFQMKFGTLLGQIRDVSRSDAEFIWVDDDFLKREDVAPWSEMPLYLPDEDQFRGFEAANIDKALAASLRFRPIEDTIGDILNWRKADKTPLKAGISPESEKKLLEKWRKR